MKGRKLRYIIMFLFFTLLALQLIIVCENSFLFNTCTVEIKDLNDSDTNQLNIIKFESKFDVKIESLIESGSEKEIIPVIIVLSEQPKINDSITDRDEITQISKNQISKSQNDIIKLINEDNEIIKHTFWVINAISANLTIKTIKKLLTLDEIARIEYDYKLKAAISDSVPAIEQDSPYSNWNSSYNGTGVVVAICDTGINENHPALQGRVVDRYNAFTGTSNVADDDSSTSHGSMCAGIINSNDSTYTGVAPDARLVIVKVFDNTGSGDSSYLMVGAQWAVTQANPKPDIINFSGGITTTEASLPNDGQSSLSFFVDAITSTYDVLWINAAGNRVGSNQIINLPADSYNCIAVGALTNLGTPARNDDFWASTYSSYGPTNDGRIKPEVVAPGTSIHSAAYTGSTWTTQSGTSFSAPHVTGAAAVIQQYLAEETSITKKYYPLVTKSILIHTATDWNMTGPGSANDGIDSNTGFGYISLPKVQNFTNYGYIYGASLSSYYVAYQIPYYYNVSLEAGIPFNLTFVWNRHASYNAPYVYYYGSGIPNNINLYLLNRSGTIVANSTDQKNNIEQLNYTSASNDFYFLKIVVEGDLQYAGEENYGLVSSYELNQANLDFFVDLSYMPSVDLNLDYIFYNNFLSIFLPNAPYNLNERISLTVTATGNTSILNGTLAYGTKTVEMTKISNQILIYQTEPLINLISQQLLINSIISGVTFEFQILIYDDKVPQSYMTRNFEITIHAFIYDIIPPAIIVLGILIAVDYIRDRRAKHLYD